MTADTLTREKRGVKAIAVLSASAFALSACASDGTMTSGGRQFLGGALGALAGYAACRASNANDTQCALLVLGGATAGVLIARALDPRDREPRNAAVGRFLQEGEQRSTWSNSVTANGGSLQLLGTTTDAQGRECRQIQEEYTNRSAGTTTPETYTMCKNPDGNWVTQS